jgi:hypothetical protein
MIRTQLTIYSYFKAKNGTYKRVPQVPNVGFDGVNGGMTVYYMQDGLYNFQQTSKVQAFQPVSLHLNIVSPQIHFA